MKKLFFTIFFCFVAITAIAQTGLTSPKVNNPVLTEEVDSLVTINGDGAIQFTRLDSLRIAASKITVVPNPGVGIYSSDVQSQLQSTSSSLIAVSGGFNNHIVTSNAHTAANINFNNTFSAVTPTTVQAAIDDLYDLLPQRANITILDGNTSVTVGSLTDKTILTAVNDKYQCYYILEGSTGTTANGYIEYNSTTGTFTVGTAPSGSNLNIQITYNN